VAERWRVGRTLGRTLYIQVGEEPSKEDRCIGLMDTRELAEQVVAAVNGPGAEEERLRAELARAEQHRDAATEAHGGVGEAQEGSECQDMRMGVRHERPTPTWCPAELPFGKDGENGHACLYDRGHSGDHGCSCGQGWSSSDDAGDAQEAGE
jgi:hypothetical protein